MAHADEIIRVAAPELEPRLPSVADRQPDGQLTAGFLARRPYAQQLRGQVLRELRGDRRSSR